MRNFLIFLFTVKKNVPWHILAPRRGCFSNHLPLRRVRILVEHFLSYGNKVSYTIIKNVPRHILAPRRRYFGNHLPLRRVRILVERFLSYGNKVSYTIKKYPRPWQICLSRTGAHHLLSCRHFVPVFPRYHLALRSYALFIRVQISFKEFKHSKGY